MSFNIKELCIISRQQVRGHTSQTSDQKVTFGHAPPSPHTVFCNPGVRGQEGGGGSNSDTDSETILRLWTSGLWPTPLSQSSTMVQTPPFDQTFLMPLINYPL